MMLLDDPKISESVHTRRTFSVSSGIRSAIPLLTAKPG